MSTGLKLVKGMKDILPAEMGMWQSLERILNELAFCYGYQEVRMPILEQIELFKRAIGSHTDIVEKEMYHFLDRGGDTLALRPEGTAQSVRLALENGLLRNQSQRVWYYGPMFRRERPQKGRQRQFYQFGVEAFGLEGPDVDCEQIAMMARLWRSLGLENNIVLQLNSLGTAQERKQYRDALVNYMNQEKALDEDSKRRLTTNPLRILDSKNPEMQDIIQRAPILLDFLGDNSREHFESLTGLLEAANIKYEINPHLVRGLDYYTHTVYEWVTHDLGAQGTVCAGGRYNDLVTQFDGPPTPAVGFALGIERLVMLAAEYGHIPAGPKLDAYLVYDESVAGKAMLLAEQLREASVRILMNAGAGSFKSQFKRADKSGARLALVLGEAEASKGIMSIKYLREDKPQVTLSINEAVSFFEKNR